LGESDERKGGIFKTSLGLGDAVMIRSILSISIILSLLFSFGFAVAAEKAPPKVYDLAKNQLAALGSDPVIVTAVKEHNAKGISLAQIKQMDEKWKGTAGVADYMKAHHG
jgi:hypothetical protein